jgi:mannitol/fructose-specific phosphotransferase system IIA component (Ntr-type)
LTHQLPTVVDPEFDVCLQSVFPPNCIVHIPEGRDLRQVLGELVHTVVADGRVPACHAREITEKLLDREEYGTTALGRGLAFPHLRTRCVESFVGAVGVAPLGIDLDSLDGLPTRLILLLLSPMEQRERHSEVMARLATLLSDHTLQYSIQVPRSNESIYEFLGFSPPPTNSTSRG